MSATFGMVFYADVFHHAVRALLSDCWKLEFHTDFYCDCCLSYIVLMAVTETCIFLPFNKYKEAFF